MKSSWNCKDNCKEAYELEDQFSNYRTLYLTAIRIDQISIKDMAQLSATDFKKDSEHYTNNEDDW